MTDPETERFNMEAENDTLKARVAELEGEVSRLQSSENEDCPAKGLRALV